MAGEWIKLEIGLPEKPEVMRLARILKVERTAVVGLLARFWIWTDKNTVDGVVDGVETDDVDIIVSVPGFGAALESVGWLLVDRERHRITVPNFERHNGESAKKRALKNERQARWRANSASTEPSTQKSTRASTREEKRREEETQSLPVAITEFEKFWLAYPKKAGKPAALKAFNRQKFSNGALEKMLGALAVHKQSRQWLIDGGRYVPNPATWLNEKRFDDEVKPGAQGGLAVNDGTARGPVM